MTKCIHRTFIDKTSTFNLIDKYKNRRPIFSELLVYFQKRSSLFFYLNQYMCLILLLFIDVFSIFFTIVSAIMETVFSYRYITLNIDVAELVEQPHLIEKALDLLS